MHLSDTVLEEIKEFKDLGILTDNGLSWNYIILRLITAKANRMLGLIKSSCGSSLETAMLSSISRLGETRPVHSKFQNEIPENVCSICSPTRKHRNIWSTRKPSQNAVFCEGSFGKNHALCTFISQTKMLIAFGTGRSTNNYCFKACQVNKVHARFVLTR